MAHCACTECGPAGDEEGKDQEPVHGPSVGWVNVVVVALDIVMVTQPTPPIREVEDVKVNVALTPNNVSVVMATHVDASLAPVATPYDPA